MSRYTNQGVELTADKSNWFVICIVGLTAISSNLKKRGTGLNKA